METMIQFDRNKVTFQPCPREFSGLWKEERLSYYEVTEEDIQNIRELYQSPDMPKSMAIAYVNFWISPRPHGFLVHDTALLGPHGGIDSIELLTVIVERFDLPHTCLERAREFGLLNKKSRCCISYGEHLGHRIKMKQCTAVAGEIWPSPAYHGKIFTAPWLEFEPWLRNHILEQNARTK